MAATLKERLGLETGRAWRSAGPSWPKPWPKPARPNEPPPGWRPGVGWSVDRARAAQLHLRKLLVHNRLSEANFLFHAYRNDLAWRAVEQAIDEQRGLLAEAPGDPYLRVTLGGAYLLRAGLQARKGQSNADSFAEARRLLKESLPGLEQLVAVWKKHQGARWSLALANFHLIRLYPSLRPVAARKAYQRAWHLLEELIREYPSLAEYHRVLVLVHLAAWRRQNLEGQPTEATATWTRLLDALRQLRHQADTGEGDFRAVWPPLTEDFTEAVMTLGEARRLNAARTVCARAVQLTEEWLHREPTSLAARRQLSEIWLHRGLAERKAGNREQALAAFRKAAEHQRAVVERAPHFDQRKYLDKVYREQGRVARDLGLLEEAEASFRARRPLWPDRPDRLAYQVADWGSLAAAVGKGKAKLSSEEKAQRQRYLKEAADLARLALSAQRKR